MPLETTHIPVDGKFSWLGAAGYLAILAYPKDIKKRNRFVKAVKAYLIKRHNGGKIPKRLITDPDILYFSKERELITELDKVTKIILKKRKPAWEIALHNLINQAIPVKMPDGKNFTINRMIENKFPDSNLSAGLHRRDNAYKAVWSPSKPVLHLMFGLKNNFPDNKSGIGIDQLLFSTDWLAPAVKNAEEIRKIICKTDAFNIDDHNTIQILPAENFYT